MGSQEGARSVSRQAQCDGAGQGAPLRPHRQGCVSCLSSLTCPLSRRFTVIRSVKVDSATCETRVRGVWGGKGVCVEWVRVREVYGRGGAVLSRPYVAPTDQPDVRASRGVPIHLALRGKEPFQPPLSDPIYSISNVVTRFQPPLSPTHLGGVLDLVDGVDDGREDLPLRRAVGAGLARLQVGVGLWLGLVLE